MQEFWSLDLLFLVGTMSCKCIQEMQHEDIRAISSKSTIIFGMTFEN